MHRQYVQQGRVEVPSVVRRGAETAGRRAARGHAEAGHTDIDILTNTYPVIPTWTVKCMKPVHLKTV